MPQKKELNPEPIKRKTAKSTEKTNPRTQTPVPETLIHETIHDPNSLTPNDAAMLQRTIGNQNVGQLIAGENAKHIPDEQTIPTLQRMLATRPFITQTNSNPHIQREQFIGSAKKHHLHVDIHQEHYKFGNDKGSRIEIGKNGVYNLDQLIVARNHLVNNGYTANGGQACIDWLENKCETHEDWDAEAGFVPSWKREEVEENPHVDNILEFGEGRGYTREDFENSLIQAKDEVLETEKDRVNDTSYYPEGTTLENLEETIESVKLRDLLASWSGFDEGLYSKEELAEFFKRGAIDHIRYLLSDEYTLETGKYDQ